MEQLLGQPMTARGLSSCGLVPSVPNWGLFPAHGLQLVNVKGRVRSSSVEDGAQLQVHYFQNGRMPSTSIG